MITKTELVDKVSERTGVPKYKCDKVIVGMCNTIIELLLVGESVQIRNFCTFECRNYAECIIRDPDTGRRQYLPAIRLPKCRMADIVKSAVKSMRTQLGRELVT